MKAQSVIKSLVAVLFMAIASVSSAENMKKLGSLEVHYIALGSTFITPEIAKAYNIERSRFNGLINISVLDGKTKGKPAKEVSITGTVRNKIGQIKQLEFREIKEGSAIYYLADISYRNGETYRFEIDITDGIEDQKLKFSQTFYVD